MKNNKWWLLGIKSWGNMLIAIVVCFMLALFFGLDSVIVKIIVQIVDIAFFGGLLYRFFWKAGSSDSNRVELKMGEKDILKGVKSGIIAAVPFLILWILLLAAKLSGVSEKTGDILMFVYSFLNTPFSPVINSIFFSFGGSFASTTALGIALTLFSTLFIVAVSGIAYYLGYKQYIIMDHIIYKNTSKKS